VFLKRITITGFKSFAGKTVLDLEPGITGIVGPNGSGKSNLADAIRWALGEQNKNRLRLSDREEVVFAGNDKRPRASLAEVVLLFDNEDGALPLELTEVEIARRLYRSGETDYRLAGRSARLSDIHALLAQAGFGAGTYAVIGQGMIDTFLTSSPTERKLLFDEAAGIRGAEIGRDAALRKLEATAANLTRLRDIAGELNPRLASLERAVAAAGRQRDLEADVAALRQSLVRAERAHWQALSARAAERRESVSTALHNERHEVTRLERELATGEAKDAQAAAERRGLEQSLAGLERERDQLAIEQAEIKSAVAEAERAAAAAVELESRLGAARREATEVMERRAELQAELASNAEAADRALRAVEAAGREVGRAQETLVAMREGPAGSSRDQFVQHALEVLKTLAASLNSQQTSLESVRLHVHKAGRLLSHAAQSGSQEIVAALKTAQKRLEAAMAKRETAIEHQTNITIKGRSLEIDLAHSAEASKRAAALAQGIEDELGLLKKAGAALERLRRQSALSQDALAEATQQLEQRREQVRELSAATGGDAGRARLIASVERAKAAAAAAEVEYTAIDHELVAAQAGAEAADREAREWGLSADGPAPRESAAALRERLMLAGALLEAHTATRTEQVAEYEEVKTRHTELTAQIADLEVAEADLQGVIEELDRVIRERFKANFAALAQQFSHYFAQLFEGGQASLELTEAEEGSYGIQVKASPAGKRLAAITALSGGERALAGVALLAAILRVNPGPFVVLDEIDAALDEANSARLSRILTELQEQSQLIVITHNRQTMKAARVLFGITTGEHHVSHLLSMRLEEASALAAR
jgi:chromosome segregation protein